MSQRSQQEGKERLSYRPVHPLLLQLNEPSPVPWQEEGPCALGGDRRAKLAEESREWGRGDLRGARRREERQSEPQCKDGMGAGAGSGGLRKQEALERQKVPVRLLLCGLQPNHGPLTAISSPELEAKVWVVLKCFKCTV